MSDTFAAAETEALQFLQGQGGQPEGQPTTSAEPSTGTEVPNPPQSGGATAHVSLADDALVELTVNGQKVVKPWKQARAEMMLHEDYTRKRQAESAELKTARENAESVGRRDQAYKALVSDPKNIIALYEAVTGEKLTQAEKAEVVARGADDLATVQDIQQARADLKKETGEVVQTAIQEFQDQIFIADIQRISHQTINSILDEKSDVKAFYGEDAADLLKKMARAKQPADAAELKTALVEAGETLAKRVQEQLQERLKMSAVKQTKLTKQGIEPPGGTGIPAAPKAYTSGKNVNWGAIDKDAEAFVQGKLNS